MAASSISSRLAVASVGRKRMLRSLARVVLRTRHCAGVKGALQTRFTGVPAQYRHVKPHGVSLEVSAAGIAYSVETRRETAARDVHCETAFDVHIEHSVPNRRA